MSSKLMLASAREMDFPQSYSVVSGTLRVFQEKKKRIRTNIWTEERRIEQSERMKNFGKAGKKHDEECMKLLHGFLDGRNRKEGLQSQVMPSLLSHLSALLTSLGSSKI